MKTVKVKNEASSIQYANMYLSIKSDIDPTEDVRCFILCKLDQIIVYNSQAFSSSLENVEYNSLFM